MKIKNRELYFSGHGHNSVLNVYSGEIIPYNDETYDDLEERGIASTFYVSNTGATMKGKIINPDWVATSMNFRWDVTNPSHYNSRNSYSYSGWEIIPDLKSWLVHMVRHSSAETIIHTKCLKYVDNGNIVDLSNKDEYKYTRVRNTLTFEHVIKSNVPLRSEYAEEYDKEIFCRYPNSLRNVNYQFTSTKELSKFFRPGYMIMAGIELHDYIFETELIFEKNKMSEEIAEFEGYPDFVLLKEEAGIPCFVETGTERDQLLYFIKKHADKIAGTVQFLSTSCKDVDMLKIEKRQFDSEKGFTKEYLFVAYDKSLDNLESYLGDDEEGYSILEKRIERNRKDKEQRDKTERKVKDFLSNTENVLTYENSVSAGNCPSGTRDWMSSYGIEKDTITVGELLEVVPEQELKTREFERVILNAIDGEIEEEVVEEEIEVV